MAGEVWRIRIVTKTTDAGNSFSARTILEDFLVQASHRGKDLELKGKAYTSACRNSVGGTFTVWGPKNYNVAINTGEGNVDIGKINGSFSAKTAKGKITFECEPTGMDIEVQDRTGQTEETNTLLEEGEVEDPGETDSPDLEDTGGKKTGSDL